MATEQCSRCRFWAIDERAHDSADIADGAIVFGFCRRNAPIVIGELAALGIPRTPWGRDADAHEELWTSQLYRASAQPATESADWCGRYEAKQASLLRMLAERNALISHLDGDQISENEAQTGCGELNAIDGRIIKTPAVTQEDVFAKLLLSVQLVTEGQEILEDDAAVIVREALAVSGVGRVSPHLAATREA